MKKTNIVFFIIVFTLLGFVLGNIYPSTLSSVQNILNKKQVRLCNNTDQVFLTGRIIDGLSFNDIKPDTCTQYKYFDSSLDILIADITTREDGILHRYQTTRGDIIKGQKLSSGKYTLNINTLLQNEFKLIEYYRGIEFTTETDTF